MASKFAVGTALALAISPLSSAAVLRGQAGNGMQPEVVARTLSNVQDEWKAQADVFAECSSTSSLPGASIVNCADAPSSFGKSCDTVVNAIVQGSGGDKDVAKEYMSDVCSQGSMSGWHQGQCHALALAVRGSMSADKYSNRASFDTNKLCGSFWSSLLTGEKQRMQKEKAEHDAAEKKAAEEAAEQEKKFEEEQKKEAAVQAERAKVEEAERVQKEAAAKVAEAAEQAKEKAVQKKAEAEVVQEAAKKKMEEAQDAEAEQAVAKDEAAKKILEEDEDAEAEVAVDKQAKAKKILEQDEDAEAEVAVDKEAKAKAAKVAPKPVVAVAKPAAKVETKPVVAKPVVAKAVAKVAVPKAAIAVTVSHKEAKPHSVHEHAEMAKKSANEAQHHLEMAKKAFEKTKTNVKEILKTGKKIEHTAGDIHTLYKPPPTKAPKPAKPSESGSISSAVPAVFALLFTVVLANC